MEPVLFELRDGVATIHLNKPDVFNSIAIEMADALRAAMGRARVEARAVVLTGSGRAISIHVYGADIERLGSSINKTFDHLRIRPSRDHVDPMARPWRAI